MQRATFQAAALLLTVLAAFSGVARGGQADDDEADHQALREFRTLFEQAASENKLDLLKPHLHEPFSIVTYTDREFTDFEAFKARWQKTRDEVVGSGTFKVTLEPERSAIFGDVAVARGNSKNVLVNGAGKEYQFTSRWTAVFRKVDGQWKVVRVHSSLDPFGNPMIIDQAWRKVLQVGIAAAVAGLVVGGLVAFVIGRAGRASAKTGGPAQP